MAPPHLEPLQRNKASNSTRTHMAEKNNTLCYQRPPQVHLGGRTAGRRGVCNRSQVKNVPARAGPGAATLYASTRETIQFPSGHGLAPRWHPPTGNTPQLRVQSSPRTSQMRRRLALKRTNCRPLPRPSKTSRLLERTTRRLKRLDTAIRATKSRC